MPRRLLRSGYGFGTKVFRGISNVLRVLVFEDSCRRIGRPTGSRVIAFEVDDQSPEDLAIALDHLRAHPAVLDVLQMPAFGKKGRMTAHIQVLAQPEGAGAGHRRLLQRDGDAGPALSDRRAARAGAAPASRSRSADAGCG